MQIIGFHSTTIHEEIMYIKLIGSYTIYNFCMHAIFEVSLANAADMDLGGTLFLKRTRELSQIDKLRPHSVDIDHVLLVRGHKEFLGSVSVNVCAGHAADGL